MEVPTLGATVRLRIPPGTSSGRQLRVRGHGVGGVESGPGGQAGDLVVSAQIVLPPRLDDRSKALLREFARLNDGAVRGADFPAANAAGGR